MGVIAERLWQEQSAEFLVSQGEIADTKTYIKGSIADMTSLLDDGVNNTPKQESFFRKAEGDKTRERCNFRKVCEAEYPDLNPVTI